MRINKARVGANEIEFTAVQLFAALVAKALNERARALHDFGEVESNIFSADAPRSDMASTVQNLCGVEQRLGRHTAPEDAKPAHFRTAFDYNRAQAIFHR